MPKYIDLGDEKIVRLEPDERALVRGMNTAAVTGRGNIAALHFDGQELADMLLAQQSIRDGK